MEYSVEQVTFLEKYVFSDSKDELVNLVSDQTDKLTLNGLRALQEDDVAKASTIVKELQRSAYGDGTYANIDELRALLSLKLWDTGAQGKKDLQQFLIEELGLSFTDEFGDTRTQRPQQSTAEGAATSRLPSVLWDEQYSWQACLEAAHPLNANQLAPDAYPLVFGATSGTSDEVKLQILQSCSNPCLLPGLEEFVIKWLDHDATQRPPNASPIGPALEWLMQALPKLTPLQIQNIAVHAPSVMANCRVGREVVAALVQKLPGFKALRVGEVTDFKAAGDLCTQVANLCAQMGGTAAWMRLRALRGLVRLGIAQGALDPAALQDYVAIARNVTFVHQRPDGPDADVHPGITCDVCRVEPIVGVRYRSLGRPNWDCCSRCVETPAGAAAQPYQAIGQPEGTVRLYSNDPQLGDLLDAPNSQHQLQEEVYKSLVEAVYWDGRTHYGVWCDVCHKCNIRGTRFKSTARPDWDCCADCRPSAAATAAEPLVEVPAPGEKLVPADTSPLAPLLDPALHRRAVAEGLLLRGQQDPTIVARAYQEAGGNVAALQGAVEMEWMPGNKGSYGVEEPLHLKVAVKGVESVGVRVYEINTWAYYCAEGREVGEDLQLAGLGATWSSTCSFTATPFTRQMMEVKCMEGRRGVFVVELLAGGGLGLTRRAIIYKGHVRCLERQGLAGHAFRLFYEDWTPVERPRIYMGGRTYTPQGGEEEREVGEIWVPYALGGAAGRKQVVLGAGGSGASTLYHVDHREERYDCSVSWYLEREALVPQAAAPLVARLVLTRGGELCPASMVERLQLCITSTDREGATSSKVVEDFQLDPESGMGVHWLRVPPWCRSLEARLTGRILLTAPGPNGEPQYQDISSSHTVEAFSDPSNKAPIWDVYLQALPQGGWGLRVLGRAGEPPQGDIRARMKVGVRVRHRLLQAAAGRKLFNLGPDEDGLIALGGLEGMQEVSVELQVGDGEPAVSRSWTLELSGVAVPMTSGFRHSSPVLVTAPGHPLHIPVCWPNGPERQVKVLELGSEGSEQVLGMVEGCLASQPGYLVVSLPRPGSFIVCSTEKVVAEVLVEAPLETPTAQAAVDAAAADGRRLLLAADLAVEASEPLPLQVVAASCRAAEGVVVQLGGSAMELEAAQVIITLLRFKHPQPFETRPLPPPPIPYSPPASQYKNPPSRYLPGIQLDPAITYALQRRHHVATHPPRPGIMLPPPSLLTRPVRTRDAPTRPVHMSAPESMLAPGSAQSRLYACAPSFGHPQAVGGSWYMDAGNGLDPFSQPAAPCLDFCPSAVVLGPRGCDARGVVRVGVQELEEALGGVGVDVSGHSLVRVVAVSGASGAFASALVAVGGAAGVGGAPVRDQNLKAAVLEGGRGIPPVMEVRRIEALAAGISLQVRDSGSAKYSVLASLEEACDLLGTVLGLRGVRHHSGKSAAAVWREWSFLVRWKALPPFEKARLLKQYASHELHFFLAHRDPEFFRGAVLPLLKSKLPEERDFMDWYLLGAGGLPQHWGAPHRWARLNAAEHVLVAAAEGPGPAARLAPDMRARCLPGKDDHDAAARYRKARQKEFQALLSMGVLDPPTRPGGKGGRLEATDEDEGGEGEDEGDSEGTDVGADWEVVAAAETAAAPTQAVAFGMARGAGGPMPPPASAPAMPMAMAMPAPAMAMRRKAMKKESRAREDITRRSALLFSPPLKTQEWGEASYWGLTPFRGQPTGGSDLVAESEFWADWAAHLAAAASPQAPTGQLPGSFLSRNLLQAASSFTSAVLALALVDLPWGADAGGLQVRANAGGSTLTASTPCLLAVKETRPADPPPPGRSSVAVTQYVFDPLIPMVEDPETGESVSRVEEGPLLAGRRYGCTAVITSTSLAPLTLDILVQVPKGSLPLMPHPSPQAMTITLPPYSSHHFQIFFYFPLPGTYPLTPLSVSTKGRLLWAPPAAPPPFHVLPSLPPRFEPRAAFSWHVFIASATDDQVLEYLHTGDLTLAHLRDVGPRCNSPEFYAAATSALRQRHAFEPSIWQYAVRHMDEAGLRELLPTTHLPRKLGPYAATPLLTLTPQDSGYHHLEFWPVVNRFAHGLPNLAGAGSGAGGMGQGGGLLQESPAVREQWGALLGLLLRKGLGPYEALQAAYHFALQGRVEDTEALLQRHLSTAADLAALDGAGGGAVMQLDYLRAWLDLAGPGQELAVARQVAEKYRGNSDPVWGPKFRELVSTLQEVGAAAGQLDAAQGVEGEVAEPVLTIRTPPGADSRMVLYYQHLQQLQVEVYEMDVELLFTLQPFELLGASGRGAAGSASRGSQPGGLSQVSYVKAKESQVVALPDASGEVTLALDAMFPALATSSVVVEVAAGGLRRTCLRYASSMQVHVMEAQGLLQVVASQTRLPVPAAYVKVFAQSAGSATRPWFHKDGYTDRRGKFDYAKVAAASEGVGGVEGEGKPAKYAILVLHESGGGAVITEAVAMQP